jgi:hypothetical protein
MASPFNVRGGHDRRSIVSAMAGLGIVSGGVLSASAVLAQQQSSSEPETGTLIGHKDRSTRLTTKVMVNDTGPYDFVVDTGANRSVISAELAVKLQLPHGAPARIHGIAGVQPAVTVNVKSFKAGVINIPLQDVPVLKDTDLGADGLLGIDAFRDRQVTLDFVRNIVLISRSSYNGFHEFSRTAAAVTSDVTVTAKQRFGQLTIVDAEASKARITCFVDSGAQRTVGNMAMRRAVQAQTADAGFSPVKVMIHGATGQEVPGEVALVPSMRVGGVHFTSFPMAFADLHTFDLWQLSKQPALMLGMDLMRLFDIVSIDFGQRQVRFRLAEMFVPTANG